MEDDDWSEHAMEDASAEAEAPVQLVCYFDSSREMRGYIEECWQEFEAALDDADAIAELAALAWEPDSLAVRVDIDNGLEITVRLYPVIDGQHRDDLAVGECRALMQIHNDGGGGVDPLLLGALLEWLLEDILPETAHYDCNVIEDRFGDGNRPLLLLDTSGQLLDLPESAMRDEY